MDSETLEGLLIDRSLGALGPAVEALLDAYVALDPAAREAGAEFDGIVREARLAVGAGLPALPVLRREGLAAARRRGRWRAAGRVAAYAGAMAACLAVGVIVGQRHGRGEGGMASIGGGNMPVQQATGDRAGPAREDERGSGGVRDFWSAARWRELAARARAGRKGQDSAGDVMFNGFKLMGE